MKADVSEAPEYLMLVKSILDTKFREPLVMEDLAGEIGVSSCHLCHVFSSFYQVSPYAYLTQVRLREASHLLLHTHLTVGDIALAVGFSSSSRFCACFRRVYGVTPTQYRHQK